jgi:hypothetical protein
VKKETLMSSMTRWCWSVGLVVAFAAVVSAIAAEPSAAPKVSTFAPSKDIATAIEKYMKRLEDAVQSAEEYKDAETSVPKDANTLILLALAAGLDDQDNAYKAPAPSLLKAAQGVAQAKDYALAKAAVGELKKATESKSNPSQLKWAKEASLPELMKAVPLINNRLKRNVRPTAFKKKTNDNGADSATLAVIAQGSIADTSQAKTPEQEKQWIAFCVDMRNASAAVNKAVRTGDAAATTKGMAALTKSCDACHEVFHQAALGKTGEESEK